jgi:hypothetical protein
MDVYAFDPMARKAHSSSEKFPSPVRIKNGNLGAVVGENREYNPFAGLPRGQPLTRLFERP